MEGIEVGVLKEKEVEVGVVYIFGYFQILGVGWGYEGFILDFGFNEKEKQ